MLRSNRPEIPVRLLPTSVASPVSERKSQAEFGVNVGLATRFEPVAEPGCCSLSRKRGDARNHCRTATSPQGPQLGKCNLRSPFTLRTLRPSIRMILAMTDYSSRKQPMCGRYTLRTRLNLLLQQFGSEMAQEWDVEPRFNVAPSQQVPVIRQVDGQRELSMLRWGLVPPWVKTLKAAPMMNNARSEEVAEKPTFRSIIKNKRCLILADGFYEWEKIGKDKLPHYFGTRGFEPFAFAGLWQVWNHGEEPVESCTIMTTHANDMVGKIHDRMPVILSPNDYDVWLDPERQDPTELTYIYEPYPAADMETYRVDPRVNSSRNEGADLVRPLDAPTQQSDLFADRGDTLNSK